MNLMKDISHSIYVTKVRLVKAVTVFYAGRSEEEREANHRPKRKYQQSVAAAGLPIASEPFAENSC